MTGKLIIFFFLLPSMEWKFLTDSEIRRVEFFSEQNEGKDPDTKPEWEPELF
jgi:hypothetical protein